MRSLVSPKSSEGRYFLAAALCGLTTLLAFPLQPWLDSANIVMLFLGTVFATAVGLGRGPAVMAAFLAVALFDFFFVQPHFSFAVADAQYLVTFAVMLVVGLMTSQLAALLSERTREAQERERETRALYGLATDLGGALTVGQVAEIAEGFVNRLDVDMALLVANKEGVLLMAYGARQLGQLEQSFARSAYERGCIVETDSLLGMGVAILFLPLNASAHVGGVLVVTPRTDNASVIRAKRTLLEAVASLVGTFVERINQVEAARRSELLVAAERLRTSILSSLSHDLRTPLTSLVGLADTLAQSQPPLPDAVIETAIILRDQAHAMHRLLSNLLEMARLQAGGMTLNKEWQPFEEIVGSSTRLLDVLLSRRRLEIDVPGNLPLVHFDAVLLERVVCNLLENAAKYSDDGEWIQLSAGVRGTDLEVAVCNDGPGFPADRIAQVFDLFVRGEQEAAVAGTGMGLAICKAIIDAHGGTIVAGNRPATVSGNSSICACVRFTLPLGTPPPAVDDEVGS